MKQLAVYSLVVAMFLLAGCPQHTKNSIDEGSYEVPKWLLGKWHEVKDYPNGHEGYFLKKENKRGNLSCYDIDTAGIVNYDIPRKIVFSKIGTKIFLSAYDPASDQTPEGYYLYELRKVSNTEIVLAAIKDDSFSYDAPSNEITKFLEEHKDNKYTYDDSDTTHFKKE